MRVLLLGATGNLGLRLIPALLAHKHTVIVYVRSPDKLRQFISPALYNLITVTTGDTLDSSAVEAALRTHSCDALVQTSGTHRPFNEEQELGRMATSVSNAAIRISRERGGKPVRGWVIGGLSSMEYPGTGGWQIQDYMPGWLLLHHYQTELVMKDMSTSEFEWSLLCVAMMRPVSTSIDVLERPRGHGLAVGTGAPPAWKDGWLRYVPFIGVYLNLIGAIMSYTTKLDDVADLIAEDLARNDSSPYVGKFVAMKDVGQKSA